MSFFEMFRNKVTKESAQTKDAMPADIVQRLDRKKFSEGTVGDLAQAREAAEIEKAYFWDVAPEGLKNIVRKSGPEGYYLSQKLETLDQLMKEKGWQKFEDVKIEDLNNRLRERREKGEVEKVEDEENPLLKYYKE